MKNEITRDYKNLTLTLTNSNNKKAWLAEIVGENETYTFERKFLEKSDCGPGWLDFTLESGKLYNWNEAKEQHFGIVGSEKLYEISKNDALEIIKNK